MAASEDEDFDGISAQVLQITPELQESCEDSSVVLSVELGSVEALAVASTPSVGSCNTLKL